MNLTRGVSLGDHASGLLRDARLLAIIAPAYDIPCTMDAMKHELRVRHDYRDHDADETTWARAFAAYSTQYAVSVEEMAADAAALDAEMEALSKPHEEY